MESLRGRRCVIERQTFLQALVGLADETRDRHIAMVRDQPIVRRADAAVLDGPADGHQRQNAVGGGSSVATKMLAIPPGLVSVGFRGGKEESAVSIFRMFGI